MYMYKLQNNSKSGIYVNGNKRKPSEEDKREYNYTTLRRNTFSVLLFFNKVFNGLNSYDWQLSLFFEHDNYSYLISAAYFIMHIFNFKVFCVI